MILPGTQIGSWERRFRSKEGREALTWRERKRGVKQSYYGGKLKHPHQPGWFEQILNSTVLFPQQWAWRLERIYQDPDVSLFDEKGLGDAALIPFTSLFANHEHDVMPDEMFGEGLGAQIAGSILTDPLMYLGSLANVGMQVGRAGLRAAPKAAKALNQGLKHKFFRDYVTKRMATTGQSADDVLKNMTANEFRDIFTKLTETAGAQASRLSPSLALRAAGTTHLKGANKILGNLGDDVLKLQDEVGTALGDMGLGKIANDAAKRQIVLGIPFLMSRGFIWSGGNLPNYSSWTRYLFDKSSRGLKAAIKMSHIGWGLSKIPVIRGVQDVGQVALRQALHGFRVGGQAQWRPVIPSGGRAANLEQRATWLTPEQSGFMDKVLSAGPDDIVRSYTEQLARGVTSDEALVAAFQAAGLKGVKSPHEIWARLSNTHVSELDEVLPLTKIAHRTEAVAGLPDAGRLMAPTTLRNMIDDAIGDFRSAQSAIDPDKFAIGFERTTAGELYELARTDRNELAARLAGKWGEKRINQLAEAAFSHGSWSRRSLNKIFHSGMDGTEHKLITDRLSRDVSKAEQATDELAHYIYSLLPDSAKAHGVEMDDYINVWLKFFEGTALPDELVEALKYMPQSAEAGTQGVKMMSDFLMRHLSSLRPFAQALKDKAGVGGEKLRALGEALGEQVHSAPRYGLKGEDDLRLTSYMDEALDSVGQQPAYDIPRWSGEAHENTRLIGSHPELYSNSFLGSLSDSDLNGLIERLNRVGERGMTATEQAVHLEGDAAFTLLRKQRGLSTNKLIAKIRSVASGKTQDAEIETMLRGWRTHPPKAGGPRLDRVALHTDKSPTVKSFDEKHLLDTDPVAFDDLAAAIRLRNKRANQQTTQMKPLPKQPPPPARPGESFMERKIADGQWETMDKPLSRWGAAFAKADHLVREAELWMKKYPGESLDTTIVKDLVDSVEEVSSLLNNVFHGALDDTGRLIFDRMRRIKSEVLHGSIKSGVYVPGAPLGYIHHLFQAKTVDRLNTFIADLHQSSAYAASLTTTGIRMGQHVGRRADSMTIEEINALYKEVQAISRTKAGKGTKNYLEELKEIIRNDEYLGRTLKIKRSGLDIALETDPFLSTIQRFESAHKDTALVKFYDDFLNGGGEGERLVGGGKVVGYYDDQNRIVTLTGETIKRKVLQERVVGKTKEGVEIKRRAIVTEAGTEDAAKIPTSGLVVQLDNGEQILIPAGSIDHPGIVMQKLARAGTPSGDVKGLGIDSAAKAFAHSAARGDTARSMHTTSAGITSNTEDLLGHYVAWGAEGTLAGGQMAGFNAMAQSSENLRKFDLINFMVKGWQTVSRPYFHIANKVSGVFQSASTGVSTKNLAMGYATLLRLQYTDVGELSKLYKNMENLMGTPVTPDVALRILPHNDLQHILRLNGYKGFEKLSPEEIRNLKLDHIHDFNIPMGDSGYVTLGEALNAAFDGNLLSTFAKDGLRPARTAAERIVDIKVRSLNPSYLKERMIWGTLASGLGAFFGGVPGMVGAAAAGAAVSPRLTRWAGKIGLSGGGRPLHTTLSEMSETGNRLACLFALIREGHDLPRAVKMTREAHVPYDQLTDIERFGIKRVVQYYTFPRHYIPYAWGKFAEDPNKLSRIVNTIRNQELFTTVEGKPHLKWGDYRIDVGRLNPNIEAATVFAAIPDMLLPALNPAAQMASSVATLGQAPYRSWEFRPQDLVNGFTDAGITRAGGVASFINPALGKLIKMRPEYENGKNTIEAIIDATWPVKMAFTAAGIRVDKEAKHPDLQYTPLERFVANSDFGLGIRKVSPRHEIDMIKWRYQKMESAIGNRIGAETRLMHKATPFYAQKHSENIERLKENRRALNAMKRRLIGSQLAGQERK